MSRNPIDVPDHGWAVFSEVPGALDAVDRVLAEDWRAFLLARSAELRDGGRIVCQFMGRGTDRHGFEWMAGAFWQSLVEMQQDGMLTEDELLRMNCPSAGRSVEQIEAPFEQGKFAGLSLGHISVVENPDPFWEAYSRDGDADRLGRSWAMAMRAANGPNFVAGLDPHRDAASFLDALTDRLAARIAASPQRSESFMVIVSMEKTGGHAPTTAPKAS
jgi:cyclopropane-fatty-acyl-phospholipid synthase